jgi:lysophospholipase L1-like esterase
VSGRGKNVVLTVVAICLALVVCEFGLRIAQDVSPFDDSNFRDRDPFRVKKTVRYDPQLGWVLKDNLNRPDLHTVAYGIRRNSPAQNGLRPGHGVAVGASITEGFALGDADTWPAQLEALTGEPVDNAGVIGYGLDQMVLRAEQLIPIDRPQLVLLGIGTPNIEWMQSNAVRGASKPFFTIDGGVLAIHNVPVPETKRSLSERIKDILGYSALIDYVMSRLDPAGWYPPIRRDGRGSFDPIAVSCRLIERLKAELDERKARAVVVIEPQWREVASTTPTPELDRVVQCARQAGLPVADTLAAWRAEYQADPQRVTRYWEKGQHRHLTAAGSRRVAEIVAVTLDAEQRRSDAR